MSYDLFLFVIAILIIALSLIPLLNNLTIISFQLPEIAQLIKSIIYVLAGFFFNYRRDVRLLINSYI